MAGYDGSEDWGVIALSIFALATLLASLELVHFFLLGASWQFCVVEGLVLLAIGVLVIHLSRRKLLALAGGEGAGQRKPQGALDQYPQAEKDFHHHLISHIVHELRSPLTTIRGLAHLMTKNWDQLSEEKKEWSLKTMVSEVQRANTMIEEIALVAKVKSGEIETRPVPIVLQEAVRGVLEQFADKDRERLEIDLPPERLSPSRIPSTLRGP